MTRLDMVRDFVAVVIEQTGEAPSVADVATAFGIKRGLAQVLRLRCLSPEYDAAQAERTRRIVAERRRANDDVYLAWKATQGHGAA